MYTVKMLFGTRTFNNIKDAWKWYYHIRRNGDSYCYLMMTNNDTGKILIDERRK